MVVSVPEDCSPGSSQLAIGDVGSSRALVEESGGNRYMGSPIYLSPILGAVGVLESVSHLLPGLS